MLDEKEIKMTNVKSPGQTFIFLRRVVAAPRRAEKQVCVCRRKSQTEAAFRSTVAVTSHGGNTHTHTLCQTAGNTTLIVH